MNRKSVFYLTIQLAIVLLVCAYSANAKNLADPKLVLPEPPKDGTPVSFLFLSMLGSGDGLCAKIRVFNHGNRDITNLRMTLNYLNEKGEKLKDFPWTHSGFPIAGKGAYGDIKVGVFVPQNTKKIVPIVKTVIFDDKSKWEKE